MSVTVCYALCVYVCMCVCVDCSTALARLTGSFNYMMRKNIDSYIRRTFL